MAAAEGEEELGSPHYGQIINRYRDCLLSADAALFPFNSQRPDGSISVILGVKGIIYFEMTATGGSWGGYTGEGTKTILPHTATAKVDSRLPPGLHPD